jgi:hypothetical protein
MWSWRRELNPRPSDYKLPRIGYPAFPDRNVLTLLLYNLTDSRILGLTGRFRVKKYRPQYRPEEHCR